ncbi:hypothetical protein CYMTET_19149 [Cymbomonas tetramitiformis]|uniref:Uncharacterized protein n=1 Tax=Cymbomonas tetramitiformis TaxID=36881 RepID=A0AAE0L564_9CHLO|nr:hypothetical protein CYMTET_19149 [Cymbomonas tetramitiformis]
MATERQRARLAAVRDALEYLREHRRHSSPDYRLVVSGGAYAPYTNIESNASANDKTFGSNEFRPQHSPLFHPPYVFIDHCLVVCGGAVAPDLPFSLSAFALVCRGGAHRIFRLRPHRGARVPALTLVMPRIVTPHRVGVG